MFQCWCEQSIPPFSFLLGKSILNPMALNDPIMIVSHPEHPPSDNNDSPRNEAKNDRDVPLVGDLFNDIDVTTNPPPPNPGTRGAITDPARLVDAPWMVLTNGLISVPAKTIFAATSLASGVHWMAYGNTAKPHHYWFFPKAYKSFQAEDFWSLDSLSSYDDINETDAPGSVYGLFRRVGAADETHRCVPVIYKPPKAKQLIKSWVRVIGPPGPDPYSTAITLNKDELCPLSVYSRTGSAEDFFVSNTYISPDYDITGPTDKLFIPNIGDYLFLLKCPGYVGDSATPQDAIDEIHAGLFRNYSSDGGQSLPDFGLQPLVVAFGSGGVINVGLPEQAAITANISGFAMARFTTQDKNRWVGFGLQDSSPTESVTFPFGIDIYIIRYPIY